MNPHLPSPKPTVTSPGRSATLHTSRCHQAAPSCTERVYGPDAIPSGRSVRGSIPGNGVMGCSRKAIGRGHSVWVSECVLGSVASHVCRRQRLPVGSRGGCMCGTHTPAGSERPPLGEGSSEEGLGRGCLLQHPWGIPGVVFVLPNMHLSWGVGQGLAPTLGQSPLCS